MSALGQKPNTGLIIIPTPHTSAEREVIISLANRYRMPAMYPFPFWVRYLVVARSHHSRMIQLADVYLFAASHRHSGRKGAVAEAFTEILKEYDPHPHLYKWWPS